MAIKQYMKFKYTVITKALQEFLINDSHQKNSLPAFGWSQKCFNRLHVMFCAGKSLCRVYPFHEKIGLN